MDVSNQQIYQELKKQINNARLHQSHILIYSFVGSGASYLLKSIAGSDNKLTYINSIDQTLGDYSLLDLPLTDALTLVDKTNVSQKCAVLINNGLDFHSPSLEKFKTHFYLSTPIGCRNIKDTTIFCREINPKLSEKEITKIYIKSQGMGKVIKHLAINPSALSKYDDVFSTIISDIISSLRGYSLEEIKSFGISLPLFNQSENIYDIHINFDLSFTENGQVSSEVLTPVESKILQKFIDNQGKISKEEVSDIKWGENKYDEFSDQAINKTIRRLDSKLKRYAIKTIPKVGFILETK